MAEPALALRNVTKRFGGLAVADDITFDVPLGARMALIGPNGAGKTTLFNLISGVYQADGGRIELKGRPIDDMPPRARVRAGLSRSFQNIRLMPHLSVVENIMLGQHSLRDEWRRVAGPYRLAAQQPLAQASDPKHA